ncbi:MAG TPA: ABC transporter permease [Rhodanobacteraceae bacterium]
MMHGTLRHDFRFAIRSLIERPAYALVTILTLALGIGANTAIFSVVKTVLLDALPFEQPGQLVAIAQRNGVADTNPVTVGYPTLLDWQKSVPSLETIAASSDWMPNLAADTGAELLNGQSVTRDFFKVLRVTPALGRLFTADDDQPGHNDVAVIGNGLWQRRFNADPGVIGTRITFGVRSYTIVGVLPADFAPLLPAMRERPPEVFRPLGYEAPKPPACRTCLHLQAIGRLANGATLASARAELDRLAPVLAHTYADDYSTAMRFELHPLHEALVGNVDRSLWLVFAGVGIVLLIACVDIAGLMSLRAASRRHELSVRAALGAGRGGLTRLLFAETLALGVAGGGLGVAIAFALTGLIARHGPASIARLRDVHVDLGVLIFASLLTLAVTFAAGAWPAWRGSRPELGDALRDAARVSTGPAAARLQSALVVAQIALACALTLGAILMARSFERLISVDPGFSPMGVTALNVAIVGPPYADPKKVSAFLDQLESRVRGLPGVDKAGAVTPLPLDGNWDMAGFHVRDRPELGAEAPEFDRIFATPDYFSTLRIPLRSGRLIADTDRLDQPPVALINEALARREWPGESPIGKQIQLGDRDEKAPWITIVGVVGDVREHSLDLAPVPQVYLAHAQSADPPNFMTLAVHSTLSPAVLGSEVRRLAATIDAGVPIYGIASMTARVADSLARRAFLLQLFGLFAGTALLLAAIGVHGTVAHAVRRRTREFGLRRAVGASDRAVLALASARATRCLIAGLVLGLPLAFAWGALMSAELYGVGPYDALSVVLVMLALAAVIGLATLAPLRRALRIDPMVALRDE